jgi:hypothetical protein
MKTLISVLLFITFCSSVVAKTSEETASSTKGTMAHSSKGITYNDQLISNKDELAKIFQTYGSPEANATFKSAKALGIVSLIFAGVGGGMFGYGIGYGIANGFDTPEYVLMGAGGGVAVIGILMAVGSSSKMKKAVKLFNGPQATSHLKLHLVPAISRNFSGAALHFTF